MESSQTINLIASYLREFAELQRFTVWADGTEFVLWY